MPYSSGSALTKSEMVNSVDFQAVFDVYITSDSVQSVGAGIADATGTLRLVFAFLPLPLLTLGFGFGVDNGLPNVPAKVPGNVVKLSTSRSIFFGQFSMIRSI